MALLIVMHTPLSRAILGGVAAFLLAGCGASTVGPALVTVTGTVDLNGTELPTGDIIFRPLDGTGHAYAGKISGGKYTLKCEPGSKKVEITSIQEIPGKTREDNPGEIVTATQQVVPEEFNTKTELTAEVAASGPNVIPFDLHGTPPKQ